VKHYNKMARQAGMTLIELTVVLLVLIGLAGLMIPYVGGFVSKTHDSANSDSLAEVNKAIQRYDVQFMGQPNNYDSLMTKVDGSGSIYTNMMGGTGTNDYLKEVTVQGRSLAGVGIDSLYLMNDATTDATFQATVATPASLDNDGTSYTVAALSVKGADCSMMTDAMGCVASDADLAGILGRPVSTIDTDANDYIVFGIGQDSGMVGKTISEAPVHFAKTGAMSAANKYNRILAVYSVPRIGCIAASGQGITEYWDSGTNAPIAISSGPTCTAAGGETLVDNTGAAADSGTSIASAVWNGTMQGQATFLTTVMPMMKLEGLGGALASHYSSVDN